MKNKSHRTHKPRTRARRPAPVKASPGVLRPAILAARDRMKISGYELTARLKGKVSRTAIYRFFSDGASTDAKTIEAFLELFDLTVVPRKPVK